MEWINLQRGKVAGISAEEQLTAEGRAGFRSVKKNTSVQDDGFWLIEAFLVFGRLP